MINLVTPWPHTDLFIWSPYFIFRDYNWVHVYFYTYKLHTISTIEFSDPVSNWNIIYYDSVGKSVNLFPLPSRYKVWYVFPLSHQIPRRTFYLGNLWSSFVPIRSLDEIKVTSISEKLILRFRSPLLLLFKPVFLILKHTVFYGLYFSCLFTIDRLL